MYSVESVVFSILFEIRQFIVDVMRMLKLMVLLKPVKSSIERLLMRTNISTKKKIVAIIEFELSKSIVMHAIR